MVEETLEALRHRGSNSGATGRGGSGETGTGGAALEAEGDDPGASVEETEAAGGDGVVGVGVGRCEVMRLISCLNRRLC